MFIQFLYVQKKDNNEEYIYIMKYNNELNNINEIIYTSLYETKDIKNINYTSKFYLKYGFKIDYDNDIWKSFIHLKLKNLNLITLLDDKKIEKYSNNDIINFNYNEYKEDINKILIDIIINKQKY